MPLSHRSGAKTIPPVYIPLIKLNGDKRPTL
jgi:hypothetical protein